MADERAALGPSALPAIGRVGVAGAEVPDWGAAATAGYGWTETVGSVAGSHHRLAGTLAGAAFPLPWLGAALVLDGRYDRHPDDEQGSDTSMVGEPRVVVRGATRVTRRLGIGADLVGWFPGSDAPSIEPEATTLDFRGLVSWWSPGDKTVIAAVCGYRLDRSAQSVEDAERLRPGDRVALGVSDFDALVLGLGISHAFGRTEILAETTGDWLLGRDAPPAAESPWRIAMGVRQHLTLPLALEVRAELLLSRRPNLAATDPLVPVEPRLGVSAGLRYAWWEVAAPKEGLSSPPGTHRPPPPRPPIDLEPPGAAPKTTLSGQITDQTGQALENAHVTLVLPDRKLELDTSRDGRFGFAELPVGTGDLRVQAPGYLELERRVALGQTQALVLTLQSILPAGQLRGLIRAFTGDPLSAKIQVEPGGVLTKTDAEGRFEIDLAPGSYRVTIEANGYRSQERRIEVEQRGVTVINAELEVTR
jgi:hypothetical protein